MERISPLPESDYTKQGKVKSLRGRMLKKLLKYEFRYLLPSLLIGVGVLLVSAVLLCTQIVALRSASVDTPLFVMSIMLYVYANVGVFVLAIVIAQRRLYKNFFKNEGALTFSVPATAEEHIFAKHLSALVCSLIALAAMMVGGCILMGGLEQETLMEMIEDFAEVWGFISQKPVNAILVPIELLISTILSLVGVPCVLGALTVFLRKYSGKKKWLVLFLLIIGVNSVLNFLSTAILLSGIPDFILNTLAGLHITIWVALLLHAGFIVLCVWYEIRVLKKKLDL